MKKYPIILAVAILFFAACNPNEDLYQELDTEFDVPYHEDIEYVFTSADYTAASSAAMADATNAEDSAYAGYIKTFESFNSKYKASDYVPAVLAQNFLALNNNSTAQVTYNEYNEDFNFADNYVGEITNCELVEADYLALGLGDTEEEDTCFTSSDNPQNMLPNFLADKYPDAVAETYMVVNYLYPNEQTEDNGFYKFDGTEWAYVDNSVILSSDDYAQMGNPGPGQYNNFSEDYPAENYLPNFLNAFYPSQNGETRFVVYDYYSGGASTLALKFVYNEGWQIYSPAETQTSQFIHIGTEWIFDPTVRISLTPEDYQIIVDYVGANIGADYVSSYGNNEFYTGASAYYNNFDIRVSKRRSEVPDDFPESMSDEDALALVWERLYEGLEILLMEKYPDAVPNIGDFEVHYFLTFDTFNDDYAHNFYTVEYKCTASGTPPTFEVVTEATLVE